MIKNTHRQVVLSTIAPPRIGPRRLANANTELRIPVYVPTLSTVTILAMMIKTVEYIPEPPSPWKARKTILVGIATVRDGSMFGDMEKV